jgi:endonuclease G, mitochondrial
MTFHEIQKKLVDALMKLPGIEEFPLRSSLLQGLPPAPLVRSPYMARLDLNNIVDGMNKLGRLNQQGGIRPLIVVAETALSYVPAGSDLALELEEAKRLLADYYGGDAQVAVAAEKKDYEALIFGRQRDTRLAFSFAEGAVRTAKSVARITVARVIHGIKEEGVGYGTGWLIGPGVLITNHHVIDCRDIPGGEEHATAGDFQAQATTVEVWFDYYKEKGSAQTACSGAQLLAQNMALDYVVLKLTEADKVKDRSALPISAKAGKLARGARMNLVQHPLGGPLKFAIRNNFFVRYAEPAYLLRYQTDSEVGASGSPVCNDAWQVVGLHHAATQVPKELVPQEVDGLPVTVDMLNEAIDIHAILDDLPADVRKLIPKDD